MIRIIFLFYWLWHLTWLHRMFFSSSINAKLFMIEGYLQWSFICLLPSIIFIVYPKGYTYDFKWWKMCMITAMFRTVISIIALSGYRYYFAGFLLTIFAIGVLLLLDKSFKKNSDSIKII